MKWYLKLAIAAASLIVLVICLNVALNWWIERQLPIIINQENDSPYHITYESADVVLTDRTIHAKNIIVVPKSSLDAKSNKSGLYGKIPALTISDYKLWDLIWSKKIHAKSLLIESPEVTLYKKSEKAIDNPRNIGSGVVAPFSKIIFVNDISLKNGKVSIVSVTTNKPTLELNGISVELEGILITDETLKGKIPFSYENFEIRCKNVYYRAGAFYDIKSGALVATPSAVNVREVKLLPRLSRKAFVKSISKEKDLFAVAAGNINVGDIKWGFRNEEFFAYAGILELDAVNANIYRAKMPPDDLSRKKLYSELIRKIPYDIKVDTLKMRRSKIVYEEQKQSEVAAGKVSFSHFYLTATGIQSAVGRTKVPDTRIAVNCRLMDKARVKVNWSFNSLDKSDSFRFSGAVYGLPVESMDSFIKPYMNAEATGELDRVYFDFKGNANAMGGPFGIDYDDLKVKIFRKNDRKKKNKFLTAIANLFVKNDTKDRVKKTDVNVDRIKEKSFFNLVWRGIAEGLKKILI